MIIPEYGRHIQKMVDHAIATEDKEERNKIEKKLQKELQDENFEADWHSYADESSPEVTLGDHFRQQQEASAAELAAPGTSTDTGSSEPPDGD